MTRPYDVLPHFVIMPAEIFEPLAVRAKQSMDADQFALFMSDVAHLKGDYRVGRNACIAVLTSFHYADTIAFEHLRQHYSSLIISAERWQDGTGEPSEASPTPTVPDYAAPAPRADRVLRRWAMFIPRKNREAIVGDLCEDLAEYRVDGVSERRLVGHVAWQLLYCSLERLPALLSWIRRLRGSAPMVSEVVKSADRSADDVV